VSNPAISARAFARWWLGGKHQVRRENRADFWRFLEFLDWKIPGLDWTGKFLEKITAMALQTRQNPASGILEVLVDGEWIRFEDYRRVQIDQAYENSIRFLRERLGDSEAQAMTRNDSMKEEP
jgi:hypothetical protein